MNFLLKFATTFTLFCFAYSSFSQVNAGPDITYVVGSGDIDLFTNSSETSGTWEVSGGKLNGSNWSIDYQSFIEPFQDFTATLTNVNGSDSKTIRAYNKIDPNLFTRDDPFTICENSRLILDPDDNTIPAVIYDNFYKEYYYQINSTGPFLSATRKIEGKSLGPGTHVIRERYVNIVIGFVFTDVETEIIIKPSPELFWNPIPELCPTDAPLDLSTYINSTTGVTISSNDASAALTGYLFDPAVSGEGLFHVSAFKETNGCPKAAGLTIKVVSPCN